MLSELEDDGFDVDKLCSHESLLNAYAAMQARKAAKGSSESNVPSTKSGKECVGNPAKSREIVQNPGKSNQALPLKGGPVELLSRPVAANPQPLSESRRIAQNPGKSNREVPSHGDKSLADGKKAGVENQALAHSVRVNRSQNSNESGHSKLEARGSLSREEATRVVEALYLKAKKGGYRVPKSVELAALRAYLTGSDQLWFNHSKLRNETIQPPTLDPRLDPASPWHGLWKKIS
jgi:hypothetical protein